MEANTPTADGPQPAAATSTKPTSTHQSGILNRPPEHLLVAALEFIGDRTATRTRETLEKLSALIQRELQSDLDEQSPETPKNQPSPETGELGFADPYDRQFLTITVGFAKSAYDALAVPADQQPQDLIAIPWSLLGDQPTRSDRNGDVVLQVCSDDPYVNEHVVRRIEEELRDRITLAWTLVGDQRYTTREGRVAKREARALIGFLDGTANLDPKDKPEDATLVFVDPDKVKEYPPVPPSGPGGAYPGTGPQFPPDLRQPPGREPEWTRHGSYMVVRASTQKTPDWDGVTLDDQEHVVGRFKFSGASLDLTDDQSLLNSDPFYAQHQEDLRVPLASHVRKSNPRRSPEDPARRVFRRGYPLIEPAAGGLQRGLLFIAFARTISTQFEFIMRGWIKNPNFPQPNTGVDHLLSRFEKEVLCGGYYFAPPLSRVREPWSWIVPSA
jgi:deferrochelatase/peroxidase EfeB